MSRHMYQSILLTLVLFLSTSLPGNIQDVEAQSEEAPDWPEGEAAYDNMVTMANFGYRKIDTAFSNDPDDPYADNDDPNAGMSIKQH